MLIIFLSLSYGEFLRNMVGPTRNQISKHFLKFHVHDFFFSPILNVLRNLDLFTTPPTLNPRFLDHKIGWIKFQVRLK